MLSSRIKLIISVLLAILSMPSGMLIAEYLRSLFGITPDSPYVMIFSYGIMFLFMILFVLILKHIEPSFIMVFRTKSDYNPLLILLGIVLLISWNITISPASDYIPSGGNAQLDQISSTGILSVLTAIIIAPVFEEWFFRGILLTNLKLITNSALWAIVISAAIFGLSHVYPLQALTAFGAGIILGIIYYRTSSLLLTAIVHMSYNGIIYVLYTVFPDQDEIAPSSIIAWSIAFGILVISLVVYILTNNRS